MTRKEILQVACAEIGAHKARSALTCFALAIGIAAMLYTLVQIDDTRARLQESLTLVGPGRITVSELNGYISKGLSPGLSMEDADAIRKRFPDLYMVHGLARRWGAKMQFDTFKNDDILIEATTPEWRKRDWVYAVRGRFFDDKDMAKADRVCVIVQPGGWVAKKWWSVYYQEEALEKLVRHRDLLNRRIILNDHAFTVIGILQEPPRDQDPRWIHYGMGGSGTVMVPITTFHRYLVDPNDAKNKTTRVMEIAVDTGDAATVTQYHRRIDALIASRHRGERDFEVKEWRDMVAGAIEQNRAKAMAVLVIGIVAILAGGIGIMNVTLATTFSRIREIGIRRALGATRSDIVSQFVTEAMVLGAASGILGSAIGALAAHFLIADAGRIPALYPYHFAAAIGLAIGASFVSSIFPARAASNFDPIEALRYE